MPDLVNPLTGETPIHIAVESGHLQIIEVFLDSADANFNLKDNEGKTALHIAGIFPNSR